MNQSPWPRRSVAPTHESERLYEYHGPVVSRKCFRWWIATSSPGRLLRRIVVSDEQDAREIVLLTNIFHPASSTLAAIRRAHGTVICIIGSGSCIPSPSSTATRA